MGIWRILASPAATLGFVAAWAAGCGNVVAEPPSSEVERYLDDPGFRRSILERDLLTHDNDYADERLDNYAVDGGWDDLEPVDPPSRALTVDDATRLAAGGPLEAGDLTTLAPAEIPTDDAAWIELGRRVFVEYPIRADPTYEAVARLPGGLDVSGFIVHDGSYIGLRVVDDGVTARQVGITCAMCHGTVGVDGVASGTLANRSIDVGAARLLAMGLDVENLPPELDSTAVGDLAKLGPGRTDVLSDAAFNPYAIPDLGGLADMPYLHHTANWHHRSTATLAVRCETLFITSSGLTSRIPRELSYAIAMYFRSLAPPPPLEPTTDASTRGAAVFEDEGCGGCHAPPTFTSSRRVSLEEIGTDPAAGESEARWTGYYRIPSLRGVGRAAPYFHHGAIPSLEELFDPARTEPGHPFGLALDDGERADLIAYLRSL